MIETVGISCYIYRPNESKYSGYAQSIADAKRWINNDLT